MRAIAYRPKAAQWVVICLVIAVGRPVHAEGLIERLGRRVPDKTVTTVMTAALSKIHTAICESNRRCAPTTPAELANPPITMPDGRAALAHGMASALTQWCGLDYRRSFLPMIAYGRYKLKMTDRQLALMSIMHGILQNVQLKISAEKGTCPDDQRAKLDAELPRMPSSP